MKVIGLTGTIGSGKEVVKDTLMRKFNSYYVTLSDIIRAEIERKRNKLTRTTLQDMGDEMRQKYGPHILAMLAVEYLGRDKELIIVDGIRNPSEAEYLRKKFGNNFKLIGVDAPAEIRFERVKNRNRSEEPRTWEEFLASDERDQGKNEPPTGLQVRKCLEQADFQVVNDGSIEDLQKKIDELVKSI